MKEFSEKDKSAIIILDSLQNLSYNQKREILQKVEFPRELFDYETINGYPKLEGVTAITYLDELYPKQLLELKDFPLCLYCLGNISLLGTGTAIVGSRKTISVSLEFAKDLAKNLCKQTVIITGTSLGVENKVLNATGGENTICFLACGIYQEKNLNPEQIKAFCQKGLIVSQYPPSVKQRGYQYIERNRLIAKLCDKMIVISGGENSGVRYSAEYAKLYLKPIYALPYSVGEPSGVLCNQLIKSGATLLYKIEDIIKVENPKIELTPDEKVIIDLISKGVTTLDKIVEQSGLVASQVFIALVSLEIKDCIIKSGADEYALTKF